MKLFIYLEVYFLGLFSYKFLEKNVYFIIQKVPLKIIDLNQLRSIETH